MKRLKYTSFLSLIYTLIFSIAPLINDNFLLNIKNDTATYFTTEILFLFLANFSIFFLLSLSRITFSILLPILFFLSSLITFYIYSLNISFSYRTIILLFETNVQTFKTAINYKVFAFSILCTIFAILQVLKIKSFPNLKEDNFGKSDGNFLAFFCIIILALSLFLENNKSYLPQSIFYTFKDYFELMHSKTIKQIPQKADYKGDEDLTVVLIVAESVRGDKFSLNRYHRETNPELSKLKNLISYNATSCEVLSIISLPCLLTNRSVENPNNRNLNLSINQIFSNVEFQTFWVNEHFHGVIKSEYENIAASYDKVINKNNYAAPEKSLQSISSILAKDGKKFITYHTFLSHWPYAARYGYDKKFEKWSPTCSYKFDKKDSLQNGNLKNQIEQMKKCDNQSLHNEYDNSIIYFDKVVNEIIEMLKNKNALVFVTSDHGESLGENGYYLHGSYEDRFIKEQKNVPFIVWFSDKFLENKNNLKKFQKAQNKLKSAINHDYIFNSTLDCASIKSKDINRTKSICH